MAIGFTVGAAFTTIVKSIVNDIIMPPVGLVLGESDFSDLFLILKTPDNHSGVFSTLAEAQKAGAVTLNYGVFINNLITFLIIAFAMFLIVRLVNKLDSALDKDLKKEKKPEEPEQKKCEFCRSTISYQATRCPNCTSLLEEAKPSAGS